MRSTLNGSTRNPKKKRKKTKKNRKKKKKDQKKKKKNHQEKQGKKNKSTRPREWGFAAGRKPVIRWHKNLLCGEGEICRSKNRRGKGLHIVSLKRYGIPPRLPYPLQSCRLEIVQGEQSRVHRRSSDDGSSTPKRIIIGTPKIGSPGVGAGGQV